MKLTHVHLDNFRCFEDVSFDLKKPGSAEPLDVALLVGGNGSGKSAFLDAVCGLFGAIELPFRRFYDALGYVPPRDVRAGAESFSVMTTWVDYIEEPPRRIEAQRRVRRNLDRTRKANDAPLERGDFVAWSQEQQLHHSSTGLIVAFDVYRLIPPKDVSGPNISDVIEHRCARALAPTISSSGELRPRSQAIKQWIVNLDFLRAKAKADRGVALPLWDMLRDALNTLLRPYVFEGVDDRFRVLFRTPTGIVPLEALSDGLRSVFVIITELLLRASLSTSNMDDVLSVEGVCLVDEIDAHLHPRFQETIIPSFRALFPNIQLIATTHSPIVVASVEPENVFRLEQEQP